MRLVSICKNFLFKVNICIVFKEDVYEKKIIIYIDYNFRRYFKLREKKMVL